jgi:hypothetical protein
MDIHPGGLVLGEHGEIWHPVRIQLGELIYRASDVKRLRLSTPIVVVRAKEA